MKHSVKLLASLVDPRVVLAFAPVASLPPSFVKEILRDLVGSTENP